MQPQLQNQYKDLLAALYPSGYDPTTNALAVNMVQQSNPLTGQPDQSTQAPTPGLSQEQVQAASMGENANYTPSTNPQVIQQAMQMLQQKGQQNTQPGQTASSSAYQAVTKPTKSVDYNALKKEGYSDSQISSYLDNNPNTAIQNAPDNWQAGAKQKTIIPNAAPITETFGERQGIEVFSGGVTTGTGIGVSSGTPLALPPGKWKVVSTYAQAPLKGFIGNNAGQGWGNNVVVQNTQSGDYLRYAHLSQVDVAPGDAIDGQHVIGLSGQSGNTTGDHLNLSYSNADGKMGDVLKTSYAKYLPIAE